MRGLKFRARFETGWPSSDDVEVSSHSSFSSMVPNVRRRFEKLLVVENEPTDSTVDEASPSTWNDRDRLTCDLKPASNGSGDDCRGGDDNTVETVAFVSSGDWVVEFVETDFSLCSPSTGTRGEKKY